MIDDDKSNNVTSNAIRLLPPSHSLQQIQTQLKTEKNQLNGFSQSKYCAE